MTVAKFVLLALVARGGRYQKILENNAAGTISAVAAGANERKSRPLARIPHLERATVPMLQLLVQPSLRSPHHYLFGSLSPELFAGYKPAIRPLFYPAVGGGGAAVEEGPNVKIVIADDRNVAAPTTAPQQQPLGPIILPIPFPWLINNTATGTGTTTVPELITTSTTTSRPLVSGSLPPTTGTGGRTPNNLGSTASGSNSTAPMMVFQPQFVFTNQYPNIRGGRFDVNAGVDMQNHPASTTNANLNPWTQQNPWTPQPSVNQHQPLWTQQPLWSQQPVWNPAHVPSQGVSWIPQALGPWMGPQQVHGPWSPSANVNPSAAVAPSFSMPSTIAVVPPSANQPSAQTTNWPGNVDLTTTGTNMVYVMGPTFDLPQGTETATLQTYRGRSRFAH
ncbi:hypothetical protein GNI_074450 [Gregarina niphandrodes]|uniref:Uncharacterized protein n=1 Tax=Gregarina niphandrodes TaxID=110365 RepID=A0A023B6Y4_GRENI|nr:hypothetical protein GNI_074450 [Gregarina niphandrodes]EZG66885.1 hypothetical protein GNI_074450 [Gregarina niphandrodes]|eukprot:XP_011130443.1 hypothetical protein GNI_074450 [Gregarina niphandrodes]